MAGDAPPQCGRGLLVGQAALAADLDGEVGDVDAGPVRGVEPGGQLRPVGIGEHSGLDALRQWLPAGGECARVAEDVVHALA